MSWATIGCVHCGEGFESKESLIEHVVKCHEEAVIGDPMWETPCGCSFDTKEGAEVHIEIQEEHCGYYISDSVAVNVMHLDDDRERWSGVYVKAVRKDKGYSLEVTRGSGLPVEKALLVCGLEYYTPPGSTKVGEKEFREAVKEMAMDCVEWTEGSEAEL